MAKTTITTGIILIAIGIVGYLGSDATPKSDSVATEQVQTDADSRGEDAEAESNSASTESTNAEPAKKGRSVTALIPAIVGGVLALCGLIALNESARKHAMHIAATVGLLGFLAGAGRGGMGIGKFISGDPSLNQRSFLFVWLMAIVCAVFVFLCVQSFRNARKQAQQEQNSNAATI